MSRLHCVPLILCAFLSLVHVQAASAADWPNHPVTVIVPFGPGGNTDMMARLAAQDLRRSLGRILSSKIARAPAEQSEHG